MMRLLECDCGFVVAGSDVNDLVATAQAHAKCVHGMDLDVHAVMAAMVVPGHVLRQLDPADSDTDG
jgi:hypothetical protein